MTNWIVTILTLTALLLWPLAPRRAAALWMLAASILLCELYRPGAFPTAAESVTESLSFTTNSLRRRFRLGVRWGSLDGGSHSRIVRGRSVTWIPVF